MGFKGFLYGPPPSTREGAGKPPSRKRKTRREAGTQSHGSGRKPDSRVAEGGVANAPENIGGLPGRKRPHMFRTARAAVNLVSLGLLLGGVLFGATPASAGILDAAWSAPTTNTDGSPLTDLASYRVYYGVTSAPCPGSSLVQVASPSSSPGPGQTVSQRLTGLTAGSQYNVAVTAMDAGGRESACSSIASAVARADFALNPTGTVNFGSVSLGSFAEQTVTVSNTGGGTVSGAASVGAPFSIVSGSPFTLGGVGASQAIKVRFTPTTTTTVSTTLTIAAGG